MIFYLVGILIALHEVIATKKLLESEVGLKKAYEKVKISNKADSKYYSSEEITRKLFFIAVNNQIIFNLIKKDFSSKYNKSIKLEFKIKGSIFNFLNFLQQLNSQNDFIIHQAIFQRTAENLFFIDVKATIFLAQRYIKITDEKEFYPLKLVGYVDLKGEFFGIVRLPNGRLLLAKKNQRIEDGKYVVSYIDDKKMIINMGERNVEYHYF